ncbi:MAG: hypothetical protein F9K18_04945 [Thermoanaerobaculia bacterium]|nr:MAG: hypothetical protein F9K18_04945 [Thermoanaerobaculia bacterium]
MPLAELLLARREAILDAADAALARTHLAHYEAAGADARRQRLAELYDLVASAVAERNLTPLLAHAEQIAGERFEAGFDLMEVQAAFNVLEEQIWREIVEKVPPSELAETLGLIGTALGAGKDRLAATYVALASRIHTPSLDLRRLFGGTEGV